MCRAAPRPSSSAASATRLRFIVGDKPPQLEAPHVGSGGTRSTTASDGLQRAQHKAADTELSCSSARASARAAAAEHKRIRAALTRAKAAKQKAGLRLQSAQDDQRRIEKKLQSAQRKNDKLAQTVQVFYFFFTSQPRLKKADPGTLGILQVRCRVCASAQNPVIGVV